MPPLFKSLYIQVLLAIIIGVMLGHFYPGFAVQLKPLGDGFIKLIKMMIAPVIFCTIVTGIAGMQGPLKQKITIPATGCYWKLHLQRFRV